MKVLIPSPLFSYTAGKSAVDAYGATLSAVLADLERQFAGIRFRIVDEQERMRPHMRFFINGEQTFDLRQPLHPTDSIQIVQALSGG
ncbi:MAG: MoaD/ThiS family protein [Myxococcaceae bacterium]|nr:MoaD/ThiS family protein [Myxococcaceae bacterium]